VIIAGIVLLEHGTDEAPGKGEPHAA